MNKTETVITKAGVPASKVLVGMALYGRSFQMTEAGCYTADCTYTGPMSGETPGECTETAGYLSNYEVEQIIAGGGVQQYSSDDGDILVYSQTQWVSWMNPSTYSNRLSWVQVLNFGGTSDWAMNLNQTFADADASNIVYIALTFCQNLIRQWLAIRHARLFSLLGLCQIRPQYLSLQ